MTPRGRNGTSARDGDVAPGLKVARAHGSSATRVSLGSRTEEQLRVVLNFNGAPQQGENVVLTRTDPKAGDPPVPPKSQPADAQGRAA